MDRYQDHLERQAVRAVGAIAATIDHLKAHAYPFEPTGILLDAAAWRDLRDYALRLAATNYPRFVGGAIQAPTPDRLIILGLPVSINHDESSGPRGPWFHVLIGGRD